MKTQKISSSSHEVITTSDESLNRYIPIYYAGTKTILLAKKEQGLGRYELDLLIGFYEKVRPCTLGSIDKMISERTNNVPKESYRSLRRLISFGLISKSHDKVNNKLGLKAGYFAITLFGRLKAEHYLHYYADKFHNPTVRGRRCLKK